MPLADVLTSAAATSVTVTGTTELRRSMSAEAHRAATAAKPAAALPAPAPLQREAPALQPTATDLMLHELAALTAPVTLRELVLRDIWAQAVERNPALLDAHSRLPKDGRPRVEDAGACESVNHAGSGSSARQQWDRRHEKRRRRRAAIGRHARARGVAGA